MILSPSNVAALASALAKANQPGNLITRVNLSALHRLVEHTPEDMIATVEAGLTLSAFQTRLAEGRQWLPLDPPHADTTTIADVLNHNLSGPRRFGYGTIREHLLGLKVVLADGRVVRNGGKVVKNVAGYDLCKLFVGAQGTLGIIVEATFKLRPFPEAEQFIAARHESLAKAGAWLDAVLESELTPVVFELSRTHVVLGFAGTREEVDWQLGAAAALGFTAPANLEHEKEFWSNVTDPPRRLSVLPSRLIETLEHLGAREFVARAGNGVIYYRGGLAPPQTEVPLTLTRRIKDAFDPHHVLPELAL